MANSDRKRFTRLPNANKVVFSNTYLSNHGFKRVADLCYDKQVDKQLCIRVIDNQFVFFVEKALVFDSAEKRVYIPTINNPEQLTDLIIITANKKIIEHENNSN
jgi:hypothetical protein